MTLDNLGAIAFLGTALEVGFDDGEAEKRITWKPPGSALYWSASKKGLLIVRKLPRRWSSGRPRGAEDAVRVYEDWTSGEATTYGKLRLPAGRELPEIGRAIHIIYRSDKWGDPQDYIHDFGANVRLYGDLNDGDGCFWIAGGDLRITPRGIEG